MLYNRNGDALVPVHTCWNENEAEVIVALLRSHGIAAVANSAMPQNIYPVTVQGARGVEILVAESDAAEAHCLLGMDAAEP